jgi:gluconate 2-dehydrogenase gamma chain
MSGISRRDVLRNLAIGAAGGSALRVIPAEAAALAHKMVQAHKACSAAGIYVPKYFSTDQYLMLLALCQSIIPKDEQSGGAVEAGTPEFIDLLTSENEDFQDVLGGGLMWLDNFCSDRYEHVFLECTPAQQREVLDLIAYRKNAKIDPGLSQGVAFFARLRNLTCDGFYTSKIGIADLQYIGNTAVAEFPGCPPVPE